MASSSPAGREDVAFRALNREGRECFIEEFSWMSDPDHFIDYMRDGFFHNENNTPVVIQKARMVWEDWAKMCMACEGFGLSNDDGDECLACEGNGFVRVGSDDD